MLILDLDAADSDDPSSMDGTASLMRIPGMTRGMLDTLVMRSPHGAHVCYRLPADLVGRVKASTHVGGTKIDLRPGGRSYVIAPGSQWHDEGGDHAYPGVIRAPMPDDAGRRILPMLPAPIRKWIEAQNAIEPDRASALVPSTSRPAPDSPGAWPAAHSATMPAPPAMGPGATHGPLRDRAYRIAMTARDQGWTRDRLKAEMSRLRAAVPAGHDPRDTEGCIRSAISKAGL